MSSQETLIRIQATPNPNAWKFVLDKPVLTDGKAAYGNISEADQNPLAAALFAVENVKQIHFFQNVITITHTFDTDVEVLHEAVCAVIQRGMVIHNPNQTIQDEKKLRRSGLSEELQLIEDILDRTVRPGLQGDGGDIEIVKYEDNKLYVFYQGACGTCPSSTTGTLMAIEGILRDEFNNQIEVIPYN